VLQTNALLFAGFTPSEVLVALSGRRLLPSSHSVSTALDLNMTLNDSKVIRMDRTMLVVMSVLLVVRLAMVALYPFLCKVMPEWAWSNNDGYDTIAINWVRTGTFSLQPGIPTAARLPLYPALIAACYAIGGVRFPLVVMVIQAFLSTATGYLLFRMTRSLFGRAAAIAATVLFVLHPQANNFVFRCATETLFAFLVMALLYSVVQYVQTRRPAALYRAAVWLALSLLTRQTLAPLAAVCAPLLLLWSIADRPRLRTNLLHAVAAIAAVALILTPWIARNYAQSGYAPILQTWVGQPLFQGTYVSRHLSKFLRGERTVSDLDMDALSVLRDKTDEFLSKQFLRDSRPIAEEVLADRYARMLVRKEFRAVPGRIFGLVLRNLILAPVLQMTWKSTIILMLWNWPLLIVASVGAVWCFCTQRKVFLNALPLSILFCYVWSVHAVVWPQARYIMPVLVPFSAFAGMALARIFSRHITTDSIEDRAIKRDA
jgi:4-amino-4-deoxy-L-arabinose transferase-like glycosyltransferase